MIQLIHLLISSANVLNFSNHVKYIVLLIVIFLQNDKKKRKCLLVFLFIKSLECDFLLS